MGSGIVTIRAKACALVLRALCVVALAMAGAGFLPAPSDIAGWPMPEGTRAFLPWRGETPPPPMLLSGARPRAPP